MKHIFSILAVASLFACGTLVSSCVEDIPEVIDELALGRCLSPSNPVAKVVNGEYVEFSWDKSKGSATFVLELYTDEAMPEDAVAETFEIPLDDVPYTAHLEADMTYYARVKARNEGVYEDSKWMNFGKAIQTYAIKSSVSPELLDRTNSSITIKWTLPEDEPEEAEISHLLVSPAPEGNSTGEITVSADDIKAGQKTVSGLSSSVKYTIAVYFKSANRGEVVAWTRPDAENAVTIKDTAHFHQLIKDGATKIIVPYADTVYVMGEMSLTQPLAIYGEETNDGGKPVISGRFTVNSGVTSLHCEAIDFDGDSYGESHHITINEATDITSISVLNCNVHGYQRGMYYDNKGANVQNISYESVMVYDIQGSGGDNFDIRQTSAYGTISMVNSTFYDGMRTFVRIDKATVQSFIFENNTVSNLCYLDDGNNKGLFNIRGAVTAFKLSENIFLNMNGHPEKTTIFPSQATAYPTEVASNFYYNLGAAFWNETSFNESVGIASGGAVLAEEPCVDSYGGIFNVTNSVVSAAGAGDPRWLTEYVEVPEDLTLEVTKPVKTWNLGDSKNFRGVADKDMVRDGIRFYVKSKPVTFTGTSFSFASAADIDASGIPADGGIGFKVDGPGSVVLSVAQSASGSVNDHLSISLDGKVMAAAHVGAENMKVAFPDIEGEKMVYIYPCGPVELTSLQWSDDIDTGAETVLETPVLSIDKASVTDGENVDVNVTWPAVNKAASYDVTIDGKTSNVTEPAFTFNSSSLDPGKYTVSVIAKPASTDLIRQPSEPAAIEFTIVEVLKPVYVETVWGSDYFGALSASMGPEVSESFVSGSLGFVSGGGTFKFGTTGGANRVQSGGGTPGTKMCYQIMASGPGTLEVTAISSGDARTVVVAKGENEIGTYDAPSKDASPAVITVDIPDAVSGDIINICSQSGSINFMSFKWTPSSSGEGIPDDPEAINEDYSADYTNTAVFSESVPVGGTKTIEKVTYAASSSKTIDFDGSRAKMNSKAKVDELGIPTECYVSFKITSPGTITHKIISGSSDDTRVVKIILVKEVGGEKVVESLYEAPADLKSSADARATSVTAEHLAGATSAATLYFFCEINAVNFYGLGYSPAK